MLPSIKVSDPDPTLNKKAGAAPHCCSPESYIRKADLLRYKTVLIHFTKYNPRIRFL